jgi:hypothetical protein
VERTTDWVQGAVKWMVPVGMVIACAAGCGASEAEEAERASTAGDEDEVERDDGMVTEGTLGTVPSHVVESTLQARQGKFLRCFTDAWRSDPLVGGEVRFVFRVGPSGEVRWVYPVVSTVGDVETERCLLDVARRARFPKPHGGEAEFSWSLGVDPMDDVRPPVPWEGDQAAPLVAEHRDAVLQDCIDGAPTAYRVTAYVAQGGTVRRVGVAARVEADPSVGVGEPRVATERARACVAERIREWAFPDPGSYPAKITFDLR